MNDYAVIRTGGKQYQVSPGDKIKVEKIDLPAKKKDIVFEKVLLLKQAGKLTVGKPLIKGKKIKAKLVEQIKGPKIRVAKFKAKSRYRKVRGHRQQLSVVEILPF